MNLSSADSKPLATPPDLERPVRATNGVERALYWALASAAAAHLVVFLAGGRGGGAVWMDAPVIGMFATWAGLVAVRRADWAAWWVAWGGLASVFATAAMSGGTRSPVLLLLLLHASYTERFLDRRNAVLAVGVGLAGVLGLAVWEGMAGPSTPLYSHSSVEVSVLLVLSLGLSGVLQAGRWDDRSQTMQRLLRSTESLRAVNSVLASTRADAVARARQQQVLARLTVHAFAYGPGRPDNDDAELLALIARCCAITLAELGGGHVRVRAVSGEVVAECGRSQGRRPMRRSTWNVDVQGEPWGLLEVEAPREKGDRTGLTPNDRLFVEGVVSLVSAAVGRARTMDALRDKESQLREAQRYEGLAFKASGVVHDLNNALTCILQNTELAREGVNRGLNVGPELDDIWRATMGATDMARHLLDSTGAVDSPRDQRVRLPEVAVEALRSLGVGLGEDISVDCDIADFDGSVPLSPGAAHQVLMNLVVNARQAMPNGGHLMVVVGPVASSDGVMVELRVSDTGPGIPPHIVERIFEPMFTTKRRSGGTGLGLATVRSIVEEAGGRVAVQTAEGEGTTFVVQLPMLAGEGGPRRPTDPTMADVSTGATILLVDDDARVRSSVHRSLERYGYRVLPAADADQALALSRQHADELDLLVTDFRMPRMDGVELGRQVRACGVDVPHVLMTGCAQTVRFRGEDCKVDRLLQKPFTPGELVGHIETLLDCRRRRSGQT